MKEIKNVNNSVKQKMPKHSSFGQVLNYVLIPIVCFFIFFSASLAITKSRDGIPKVFGYSLVRITTGSMEKAGFKVGSCAFIKAQSDYEIDNCIAFYDYSDPDCTEPPNLPNGIKPRAKAESKRIVFHQIYDIETDANGEKWYITKGSNNSEPDSRKIYQSYVIGGFVPLRKSTLNFFNFILSVPGVIIIVCLPCLAIIINNVLNLKKIAKEHQEKKNKTENK